MVYSVKQAMATSLDSKVFALITCLSLMVWDSPRHPVYSTSSFYTGEMFLRDIPCPSSWRTHEGSTKANSRREGQLSAFQRPDARERIPAWISPMRQTRLQESTHVANRHARWVEGFCNTRGLRFVVVSQCGSKGF